MSNFNDEQIADEKSMCNLAGDYARLHPKYNAKVKINAVDMQNPNIELWNDYQELFVVLEMLSRSHNKRSFRTYFNNLLEQNKTELQNLILMYSYLDGANISNPIFRKDNNSCLKAFQNFLLLELSITNHILNLFTKEDETTKKQSLLDYIRRHLSNLNNVINKSSTNT